MDDTMEEVELGLTTNSNNGVAPASSSAAVSSGSLSNRVRIKSKAIQSIENQSLGRNGKINNNGRPKESSLAIFVLQKTRHISIQAYAVFLLFLAMIHFLYVIFHSSLSLNENMGFDISSGLHVISAYPRVPTLPGLLVMGVGIGSGVDIVANWLVSSGACPGQFSDQNTSTSTTTSHAMHFFDNQSIYQLGSEFYSGLFRHCEKRNDTQLIIDATPETLLFPSRVHNIYSNVPGDLAKSLKMIVILRESLSREFYLYNQNKTLRSTMNFDEYAEHIKKNFMEQRTTGTLRMAVDQLSPWTEYFKRSHMLILSYDELEYNRNRFMWRIEQFLGKKLNGKFVQDEENDVLARQVPPVANEILEPLFWGKNKELYHWLDVHRGPKMEQIPFLEFELGSSPEIILPNVLLVGAQFSGITLISDLLFHNDVCGPALFNNDRPGMAKALFFDQVERYNQGLQFYAKRYKHCQIEKNTKLIVDGTPNYLTYHDRVHDIYQYATTETLTKLKIVMVLSEPLYREKRVYQFKRYSYNQATDKKSSWFQDILDKEGGVLSFEQYAETVLVARLNRNNTDYASEGKYVDHLRKWFKYFQRHQFLIIHNNELENNPKSVQWRVEKFLGTELTGSLGKSFDDTSITPRVQRALGPLFDAKNQELYDFLKSNTGPFMEQNPFPPFEVNVKEPHK